MRQSRSALPRDGQQTANASVCYGSGQSQVPSQTSDTKVKRGYLWIRPEDLGSQMCRVIIRRLVQISFARQCNQERYADLVNVGRLETVTWLVGTISF